MPFDRLIRAVDQWAMMHADQRVIAQIGDSTYVPQAMAYDRSLPPSEFVQRMIEADVVIAHAGMGSIISAAEFGKPMVLLPRRGSLRETRNDHQIATAKWLRSKPGIFVADSEDELPTVLARALADSAGIGLTGAVPVAMIANLKSIIDQL
jgi:UDP-N-acetylglucosamine transferase subunit ALG13